MSVPGFDAVGHLSVGQLGQNYSLVNQALPQAAGVGVARAFTPPTVSVTVAQAAGIGVAGTFAKSVTITIGGVAGTGVARAITPNPTTLLVGVAGIGVAGTIAPLMVTVTLAPAVGIGTAGVVMTSSTSPTIVPAAGTGVAGQITPQVGTGALAAARGTGVAGQIRIVVSGGGGSKRKPSSGLEPVHKAPPQPKPVPQEARIPVPPFARRAPALAPPERQPDKIIVSPAPERLMNLQDQILEAEDETDVQDIMRLLELLD